LEETSLPKGGNWLNQPYFLNSRELGRNGLKGRGLEREGRKLIPSLGKIILLNQPKGRIGPILGGKFGEGNLTRAKFL